MEMEANEWEFDPCLFLLLKKELLQGSYGAKDSHTKKCKQTRSERLFNIKAWCLREIVTGI